MRSVWEIIGVICGVLGRAGSLFLAPGAPVGAWALWSMLVAIYWRLGGFDPTPPGKEG